MNVVTALLMSKKKIIKLFEVSKAYSADSAKSFDELGIFNPEATFELLYDNVISATEDGKYYLNKN
ncbi:hypothetical protein SAMN02910265_02126 [Ruminococcus flavefaciens]|jgi:hypothetical protein|uniref:Uncharacterized protein n=1 Tax=Ruminococcus flavefaciens TaxID=1265 RepID=A0A1H6K160_RUMFL|nr:hypothetical protein [Ruminococcus flavefaciens]SEH68677.1 hypothetical protein SAMN02910265_02126 [Ruminococcus flavefaciens]